MVRKTRFLGKVAIASVVLVLLAVGVILAAAVMVDSFDTGSQSLSATAPGTDSNYVSAPGALGSERDVRITAGGQTGRQATFDVLTAQSRATLSTQSLATSYVVIEWDGVDNDPDNLNYNLTGADRDLTDGGTNDGFHLLILFDDLPASIILKVYTDASHWSQYTLNLPGGITSATDYYIPFSSFSTGGGASGPANFSDVGAVVLEIDGTSNAGLDLDLDLYEAEAVKDFGDLPETGSPSYAGLVTGVNAGRHVRGDLYLGTVIDTETDGQPSAGADGDDVADVSDEDGVVRTPGVNWSAGANGGSVDVTVNGCSGTCYLNGWIDWGNDGSFDEDGDQIFSDKEVSNGTKTLTFNIPTGQTFDTSFYARFRLCDAQNTCNSVTGEVTNGEVEDYKWSFGPNAVTLTRLEATSVPSRQPVGAAAAALALLASSMVVGGVLVLRRRGRLP